MRRELVLICLVAIPLALSAQNASPAPQQAAPEVHNKNANATQQVKGPSGDFVIWYDPTKWRIKEANPTGYVLEFETTNGEGHATISSDEGRIRTDVMADTALVHARMADPGAKITAREKRIVNGREVLMQQIKCTFARLPLHFYT